MWAVVNSLAALPIGWMSPKPTVDTTVTEK